MSKELQFRVCSLLQTYGALHPFFQARNALAPVPERTGERSRTLVKVRKRSSFSQAQVTRLEREFRAHRYLSSEQRSGLASALHLSEQQIKIWFQNRRYKTKRKATTNTLHPLPPTLHQRPRKGRLILVVKDGVRVLPIGSSLALLPFPSCPPLTAADFQTPLSNLPMPNASFVKYTRPKW